MDEEVSIVKEVQGTLSAVILQMMNNVSLIIYFNLFIFILFKISTFQETRKVCFSRCFDGKFGDSLTRNDQICLAKCMDRMYEAHTIVVKAVAEMAQSLNNELS